MKKTLLSFLGGIVTLCAIGAAVNYYGPPASPDQYGNTVLGAIWQASPTTVSNTIIGYGSAANVPAGTNDIFIGSAGVANDYNQIRIGSTQTNTAIAGNISTTSGTNITTILPSTGYTNNSGGCQVAYIYATNGVVNAYAGDAGTNLIQSTAAGVNVGVWTFALQNGWCVQGTNVTGHVIAFP